MGPAGQQASDTAVAGVIARPPFLYLACLVLGLALDRCCLCRSPLQRSRWSVGRRARA
jgi:hypothetical protein